MFFVIKNQGYVVFC